MSSILAIWSRASIGLISSDLLPSGWLDRILSLPSYFSPGSLSRFLSIAQDGDAEAPPTPPPAASVDPIIALPKGTPQAVEEAWQALHQYPLFAAFSIALVSYVIAKIAQFVMNRGVKRVTSATRTEVDDKLLALAQKPVFLTVFLGGLSLAARAVPNAMTDITISILLTLLVLAWLGAMLPGARLILDALGRHSDKFPLVEPRTIPLFDIFSKVILIGGGGFALFEVWGINPAPVFASAGVIGIAVGFAARDTLANLFAGIFIIADSPYKLGDFITLDSGERGLITHVGIRSTRLLTRDDIEITLPNSVIGNAKILNESGGRWEKERIRIKVGVAYGTDVDQVCDLLVELATDHEHICPEPKPRVRMRGFGDSSLDFELLAWIDEPVLRGKLSHELYMDIYKAFTKAAIEIPFPQRDVWVRRVAATDEG